MTSSSHNMLDRILVTKRQEVEHRSRLRSYSELEARVRDCDDELRGFKQALESKVFNQQPAVIAELKKGSPSKGTIRQDFDLFTLARSYERGGATCLSVVTDEHYFQGHDSYIDHVRHSVDLPLLRKDFIVDPYQVLESRLLGADAILLIVAALAPEQLKALFSLARSIGLDVLIEVHTVDEYRSVAPLIGDALLGVNNRDLTTFEVDLQHTFDVSEAMEKGHWCIAESGIQSRDQIDSLQKAGVYSYLIGETFMRYPLPEVGLKALFPELSAELGQGESL